VPRAAVPVVVDESLKSLEEPRNQQRISQIFGKPEMQRAVGETARAAVEGVVENVRLTPQQRAAVARDVDAVVAGATRVALASASAEVPRTLGPAVSESLATALDSPRLHGAIVDSAADATRAALVTSRTVLEEMHQEEQGPDIFGRMRRLIIAACASFFALGACAAALGAWAIHLRAVQKRTRSLSRSSA
jgi:hypothetical protein